MQSGSITHPTRTYPELSAFNVYTNTRHLDTVGPEELQSKLPLRPFQFHHYPVVCQQPILKELVELVEDGKELIQHVYNAHRFERGCLLEQTRGCLDALALARQNHWCLSQLAAIVCRTDASSFRRRKIFDWVVCWAAGARGLRLTVAKHTNRAGSQICSF